MSGQNSQHLRCCGASLLTTLAACFVFLSVFFLVGAFGEKQDAPFYKERLVAFGATDTRAQVYAYFAAILFIALVTLFDITGLIARRIRTEFPVGLVSLIRIKTLTENYTIVFQLLVFAVSALCVVKAVYDITPSILDTPILAEMLNASDPHIFAVFAEAGENISRAPVHRITSGYGFLLPTIYAGTKIAGLSQNYLTAYALIYIVNICFALTWLTCTFFVGATMQKKDWLSIVLISLLISGPISQLMLYGGPNVLFPNLSAYRFLPFGLVFTYCLVGARHSLLKKICYCSILSTISLFISQDSGIVSIVGFLGIVLLHDIVDWSAVKRAAAFVAATALTVASLHLLLRATLNIDILASILASFISGTSGYGGAIIQWRDANWIVAAVCVFTFVYFATRARNEALAGAAQGAAVISGMILLWYVYYVYRPSAQYWIYSASIYPLAAVIWNEARRLNSFALKAAIAVAVAIVSFASVALTFFDAKAAALVRAIGDIRATEVFGGVHTDAAWVRMMRARQKELEQASLDDPSVLPITALPFASLQIAPHTRTPSETLFSFNSPARLAEWRKNLCADLPAALLFDGERLGSYDKVVSDATKARVMENISDVYAVAERTDFVEVWRIKGDWPDVASRRCGSP